MASAIPETVNHIRRTAGYVHFYENQTAPDQELSGPMRELIATCQLCAKNDDRFAPNHVRRLYRMGVTNRVIFEAGAGIAPVVGWSTIAHVAQAILTANDPKYPFGELPPGGEPKELTPFPELSLGRSRQGLPNSADDGLLQTPEWRYVAKHRPGACAPRRSLRRSLPAGGRREGPATGPGRTRADCDCGAVRARRSRPCGHTYQARLQLWRESPAGPGGDFLHPAHDRSAYGADRGARDAAGRDGERNRAGKPPGSRHRERAGRRKEKEMRNRRKSVLVTNTV